MKHQHFGSVSIHTVTTNDATIAHVEYWMDDQRSIETYGTSRRSPIDKFDSEIAVKLATARALTSLVNRLEKQANGRVADHEKVRLEKIEHQEALKRGEKSRKTNKRILKRNTK